MHPWRRIKQAWRERLANWVRKRQGADALPVTVRRQRLYILPTRAGLGLGALLLFMLLAGLNYGNNLALLATFLLMGFVLVGMNLCHRNLQDLRIIAATTHPGFAGAHGQLQLTLDAGGAQSRWAVRVACGASHTLAGCIAGHGSARVELAIAVEHGAENRHAPYVSIVEDLHQLRLLVGEAEVGLVENEGAAEGVEDMKDR